jgi:heavy metal translocating P-type ATPase
MHHPETAEMRPRRDTILLVARSALAPASALLIIAYLTIVATKGTASANRIALPALLIVALPLIIETGLQALRGQFATDAIASISIVTALLMRQPLPGLIIVLMQSGGEALERMAQRRAGRALELLEAAAPRVAQRWNGATWQPVPINEIRPGERLIIAPGNVVPVDGVVIDGESSLDTAAITGEPMPIHASPGSALLSGYINGSGALVMDVTARAAESNYARIVQLVRSAQENKAPLQRMADRYAVWLTPIVVVFGLATYLFTGNMQRVLAVLVIATPCPLILAAPIAIIAGINNGARMRILFRTGGALESLATIRAVVFDKTGTLTIGRPIVVEVVSTCDLTADRLLALVAGIETRSSHALAAEIVAYARRRGVDPAIGSSTTEQPGKGIQGMVGGAAVAIGSSSFIAPLLRTHERIPPATEGSGEMRSWIAIDGTAAGYVVYRDTARPGLALMLSNLRDEGVRHIEILSGDEDEAVRNLAASLDVDETHARLHPADKLEHLQRVQRQVGLTAMVGDGTNDAPALAAADVGVAVTPRGGGIAAETADVILLGDDPGLIATAMRIAKRTIRIARQSIVTGLTLSGVGMIAAATGYLEPVPAAALQEVIDVLVILNVLRITRLPGRTDTAV